MRRWMPAFSGGWIKRLLPKGLFGRTILIIVLPTFLTLSVATFVFFDRHWYTITHRLTHAVAGEIGLMLDMLSHVQNPDEREAVLASAEKKLDLNLTFKPDTKLPRPPRRYTSPLRHMLSRALRERVVYPHFIDMKADPGTVIIYVQAPEGLYTVQIPERRIYTPTTEVFIGWMIGSSILLSTIALVFMRNQVRPVRRLAAAAEAIGKGQDVPWFKPEGATEVRQAAAELLVMHDRLRRAMTQRTTMLAGVSHDLRTPLTRMKLELAMMADNAHTRGFQADIAEMETMLEAYLAFARGEEAEQSTLLDLGAHIGKLVEKMKRETPNIALSVEDEVNIKVRPNALNRCVGNLIANAARFGQHAAVTIALRDYAVNILVDDDGPGIPDDKREEVFRPFLRLDESRNMETGGVGLGLTIARDIARAHGGDISLEESPMGGLRARVWLPV